MRKLTPFLLLIITFGVFWRYYHIFIAHPARDYIYSDMKGYLVRATNFCEKERLENLSDIVYPPGYHLFLGSLYCADKHWNLLNVAHFILSVAMLGLLYSLASFIYNKNLALFASATAAIYFPFIDYSAYFLSETLFTALILLGTLLFAKTFFRERTHELFYHYLFAGLVLGLASIVKLQGFSIALGYGALFFFHQIFCLVKKRKEERKSLHSFLGFALGLVVVLIPAISRCTTLNKGDLCFVSTNGALNFFIGHYPDLRYTKFTDEANGLYHEFGSPSAAQREKQTVLSLDVGPYDTKALYKIAWQQVMLSPTSALKLSFEHVIDIFGGTRQWPSEHTAWRSINDLYRYLYLPLVLFPVIIYILANSRNYLNSSKKNKKEFLLIIPIISIIACVFIGTGEARYRVPYDGYFILLALAAWSQLYNLLRMKISI